MPRWLTQPIAWKERVQLLRSPALTQRKQTNLEERLRRAEQAVRALTPPVGPGKKQCRDEAALRAAVNAILERCDVTGLLRVSWERQEHQETKYVGPGRGSAQRATRTAGSSPVWCTPDGGFGDCIEYSLTALSHPI